MGKVYEILCIQQRRATDEFIVVPACLRVRNQIFATTYRFISCVSLHDHHHQKNV
jgi:hypothetical protein